MRVWSLTLGVICLITGGIWFLQGVGVIKGSFMIGQQRWLIIGVVVALVFGVAPVLVDRVSRRGQSLILGLAAAVVTAAIGLIAASPANSVISLLIEIAIFGGSPLVVYAARQEYAPTTAVSSDRRLLM